MDHPEPLDAAKRIASLLPAIMQQLFTLEDDTLANLPIGQLRVCSILRAGPQPMTALSRKLSVSLSAMTQIADRLERANLVSREAIDSDRRIRFLQLTPLAKNIMDKHEENRVQSVMNVINHLSPKDCQQVEETLDMLFKTSSAIQKADHSSNGKGQNGPHYRQEDLLIHAHKVNS